MRLHFENNIFVVSRSPRARPFAFNHLETLVLRDSYKVDCKTVGFFLKISKEIGKVWLSRPFV